MNARRATTNQIVHISWRKNLQTMKVLFWTYFFTVIAVLVFSAAINRRTPGSSIPISNFVTGAEKEVDTKVWARKACSTRTKIAPVFFFKLNMREGVYDGLLKPLPLTALPVQAHFLAPAKPCLDLSYRANLTIRSVGCFVLKQILARSALWKGIVVQHQRTGGSWATNTDLIQQYMMMNLHAWMNGIVKILCFLNPIGRVCRRMHRSIVRILLR